MTESRTDIFTPDPARPVAWIAYVCGVEIPAVAASVGYGVWQIPTCNLVLVPDPLLHRLGAEDRIPVQVFYCDYWQTPDNEIPKFRLMFDGEIVGWSYINTPNGRQISFTCIDYIQIFQQLFFFFMSSIEDIGVGKNSELIGMTSGTIQMAGLNTLYPYSLFSKGLATPKKPQDGAPPPPAVAGPEAIITRPIDYLYNVVRALKDSQFSQSIPGQNFFRPWMQKNNFHKRFIALPFLEEPSDEYSDAVGVFPILRAVNQDQALAAVANLASDIGHAGSVWDMVRAIYQTLMMEIVMLPTAACVDSNFGTPTTTDTSGASVGNSGSGFGLEINGPSPPPSPENTNLYAPGISGRASGFDFLTQYFVKPQFLFGIPPVCNVFFPSQIAHLGYEENYLTQPTRTYFNADNIVDLLHKQDPSANGDALASIVKNMLSVAHPEEANQLIRKAGATSPEGKNMLIYPEEFFKGPVVDRRALPRWFHYIQKAGAPSQTGDKSQATNNQVAAGDSARDLFRLYAGYEYHKERYSRRTGAVQLAFNPYPVPGFPCVIFDRRTTQLDMFGYIMTVNQSLAQNGWSTSISYSYARTVKETFSLLARHYEIENLALQEQRSEIENAVTANEEATTLSNRPDPVGAIMVAPPEPLREIRDIIQNLDKSELFYRSLFYRNRAPFSSTVDASQVAAEISRVEEVSGAGGTQQSVESSLTVNPDNRTQAAETQSLSDLQGKKAAFTYNDVFELTNEKGEVEEVTIIGVSGQARARITRTLQEMKSGTASDVDVLFVQDALKNPNLQQQHDESGATVAVTDPNLKRMLDTAQTDARTTPTYTNLSEDKNITIKPTAQPLFESYDAAMRYNARPICTLDEYIQFLGPSALRSEAIEPNSALVQSERRSFPAVYYRRIRYYRPGPPPAKSPIPITRVSIQTGLDGMADLTSTAEEAEALQSNVQAVPNDFPETRENWVARLLQYRDNVILTLPPRT